MPPELNRRRALVVLEKIDEILAWEQTKERERDQRFVELGQHLCEVRAGQYWRLENLKSFDEFLEKRFPASRRKAYYLLAIHEHLTRIPKQQLREVGWAKATELVRVVRRDGAEFDCATWLHKAKELPKEELALMLGSDKSRGYSLEMICADFLAGAALEKEETEQHHGCSAASGVSFAASEHQATVESRQRE